VILLCDGAPPAAAELEPNDSGVAVASLPAGRFLGVVVADLDRRNVLRLGETFAEPLSRHLA